MSNSVRRSTRIRRSNPKYATDDWSEQTLRQLRASSHSSESETDSLDADANVDVETNFAATLPGQTSPTKADVQGDSISENDSSAMLLSSDDSLSAANLETPDPTISEEGQHDTETKSKSPGVVRRVQGKEWALSQGLRSRNLDLHVEKAKRGTIQQFPLLFGPAEEDLQTVLQAREIWGLKGRDSTLPSRASLYREARLRASSASDADNAQPRVNRPFNVSLTRQRLSLEKSERAKYVIRGHHQDIVTGPWPGRQISTLAAHHVVDAGQGYSDSQTRTQPKGWLLNVGARVQCLTWMPVKGDSQILTIVPTCTKEQRGHVSFQNTDRSPAFSPSALYPSSIQFWRIPTVPGKPTTSNVSGVGKPVLVRVTCVDWGDIKLIDYNRSKGVTTTDDTQRVVDLIVLSSDGNVRMFPVAESQDEETIYEKVDRVPFVARPAEETIFTTFSLATAEDLAVGASDGTVSMFSLRLPTGVSSPAETRPYLTIQLHATYVSSLAFATDLPQYLASQSAGGDLVLIDLRSPHQDRVSSHKTRLPTRNLAYLPFTRAFLTTSDSAGNSETSGTTVSALVCHSLRHFYFSNTVAKLPEASGVITAMATSTAHPCVLVANSQGQVFATNSVRKILPGSSKDAYLHKLFEYDWRVKDEADFETRAARTRDRPRQNPANSSSDQTSPADLYHQPDPRPGMSRLIQGFRPERIELGPGNTKRPRSDEELVASSQVIFEEEQAVTAMAWNTNISAGDEYGGWAAVAWGSGVVWLGDLGHDAK